MCPSSTFACMTILEVAAPLIGVGLGWALTQASTWWTAQQADQRVVKEALYVLLELHSLLTGLLRINELAPEAAITLRKQFPKVPPPEYEAALDEMLAGLMREAALPLVGQQLADLKTEYAAALLKLATVDPVNAFRLRGRQDILTLVPQLANSWRQALTDSFGEAPPALPAGTLAQMRKQLEPQQVADTQEVVREVVLQLAARLDKYTRQQVQQLLNQPEPDKAETLADLKELAQQAMAVQAELMPPPSA